MGASAADTAPSIRATTTQPDTGALQSSGNVTWNSSTTFDVDLTHTSADTLTVNGNVTLGNALLTGPWRTASLSAIPSPFCK